MTDTTYEIIGRYGNVLATAETLDMAKADVRYRMSRLGQSGLHVRRSRVIRDVVYRPRAVPA